MSPLVPRLALLFPLLLLAQAQSPLPLRDAAASRNLLFGAAADADEFGINPSRLLEPAYASTLGTQFNMLEPENAMKWAAIHPTQTTYNFEPGDQLVSFAQAHGMKVRGHNLCWDVYNPDWLINGSFSPTALSQIFQDHIATVVSHYNGQIVAWDVVNEAVSDSASGIGTDLKDSIWYNQPGIGQTGTGYIEQAFRWARAADPSALLFYNDYSIEQDSPKFEAVFNMAKDFVSRGVPINGIGFQMHIDAGGSYPDLTQLASNIDRLAALGLQVHITEMDAKIPAAQWTDPAALAAQATTYSSILTTCLQHPTCTAFQTWGFTDKYSWIPGATNNQYGAALPFDANYAPKPAASALLAALQSVPPQLLAANIVNAATYAGGAVAPGELVTLFGANFGPASLTGLQLDTPTHVATNLGGVEVLFDGVPASVIYSSAAQTSVIVPYEVAGATSTTVVYRANGIASPSISLPVVAGVPGLFSQNASGKGPGSVLNFDASTSAFTLNTSANPAPKGSTVVIYGTGAGLTQPAAVDGQLAPGVARQQLSVTATIAGLNAAVLYAGAAPGEVSGVTQFNVVVPATSPSGDQELIVTVGGISSPSGLTLSVE